MDNLTIDPIGPKKRQVAGTLDGTTIYSDAVNLVEQRPSNYKPVDYGKYADLGLFEEGSEVNGARAIKYKDNVGRPYNSEYIKSNLLPYLKQLNGREISFEDGGFMPVAPIK